MLIVRDSIWNRQSLQISTKAIRRISPVFVWFKVVDESEAIALVHDTPLGSPARSSAATWAAQRLSHEIDADMVFINHPAWTALNRPASSNPPLEGNCSTSAFKN